MPATRSWIWLAIVVVVGVFAIVALGDVRHLGDKLADFSWSALAVALALASANYVLRFVRWQIYLRHQQVENVPTRDSAVVFFAGLSLSMTPAKVGELLKSYLLREMHGVPVTKTAPIVIAERVTDLIALLVLAIIGVAAFGVSSIIVPIAAGLIAVGLVLLAWPRPAGRIIDLVTTPKLSRRFRDPLHEMYRGLAALCRPRTLIVATLIAIPAWGAECVGFSLIVNGFANASIGLPLAMTIYAVTTIAGALSFLPGGLGVTEGAMTMMLVTGATRLDRATALDATLLTRLATLWFAIAIGLVFVAIARRLIAQATRA